MKFKEAKPALFLKNGNELALSGRALAELLKAVIHKGVPFRFMAKGFSMSPFIKDGDVLTVFPLSDKPPGIGSVVVYISQETGQPIVHRVVAKKGGHYRIQGDRAFEMDGLISKANIVGIVRKVERNGNELDFGLGLERMIIGIFFRFTFLFRFLFPLWKLIRPHLRRSVT